MSFLKRIKSLGESVTHRANLRKEKVATDLAILIANAGLRRKDVAAKLNITEAALSSRLKGNANLSLDTIGSICDVACVEFDVVFRKRDVPRNLNYWEIHDASPASTVIKQDMSHLISQSRIKLPHKCFEFESDILVGKGSANDHRLLEAKYEAKSLAA